MYLKIRTGLETFNTGKSIPEFPISFWNFTVGVLYKLTRWLSGRLSQYNKSLYTYYSWKCMHTYPVLKSSTLYTTYYLWTSLQFIWTLNYVSFWTLKRRHMQARLVKTIVKLLTLTLTCKRKIISVNAC